MLPSLIPLNNLCCSRKKMSSCLMNNQDSDDEVDLEALRLAALKSRKPKYVKRVNHNNLIPIVPISVENADFTNTKIKVEKLSPPPNENIQDETKAEGVNKENEEDKASNSSESTIHDQDILSMDDKEEEDSLERLMDQLEAEISGKAPLPTNKNALISKNSSDKKDKRKKSKKNKTDGDDEVELVHVKTGRECEAVIEIRESASPEGAKNDNLNKQAPSEHLRSPNRRSRSFLRSRSRTRSRSPFSRGRSYRRSRSPYWSRSPRRSRSPFRRSRSPFWLSRRSRSSSRKPRSPLRRYRSPGRRRSPFMRFSRSRSRSFERRRPSWSLSPRRRSKSPYFRDTLPPGRRRNFNSPPGRPRRSFSPRDGSRSPRRRSRSPRGFSRNSPFRRSKSPFRRSRSPIRRTKSPIRRSQSPFLHRSKSPISKVNSPLPHRSPQGRLPLQKRSKSPSGRSSSLSRRPMSSERASKPRSKSPSKYDGARRSPRHVLSKDTRSLSNNRSPTFRRNRSPLRAVEKNKLDMSERNDKPRDGNRNEKRHRSLSRENHRTYDRRSYRQRHFRRFSPGRSRKSADREIKKSKSPKPKDASEKNKEDASKPNPKDAGPTPPIDPILEARKKKFESLSVVDPTIDKKISLKSIKESTENAEDDEDALSINLEGNLWDESEESEDEFESRFKSGETKKNRTVLSFRNLRENDAASRKITLNKPLIEDSRSDRYGRSDGQDRRQGRRYDRRRSKYPDGSRSRIEDNDSSRNRLKNNEKNNIQSNNKTERRVDRKPITWSNKDEGKRETDSSRSIEVTTTHNEVKEDKSKSSEKAITHTAKDKVGKENSDVNETDDFDKLISDFEKELESDICLSTNKEVNSTVSSVNQGEVKKSKISLKKSVIEPKTNVESTVKKPTTTRTVRATEASLNRLDKAKEIDVVTSFMEDNNGTEIDTSEDNKEGPEDYVEDDDFFLDESTQRKQRNKVEEEEDGRSDLRAVLSRRRNERLTKAVYLQENMPTRLVQSAFQGLGNKKAGRQDPLEFPSVERNMKNAGGEGRRVLLLQRNRNPSIPTVKCTVPEVQPDTTIYQRFTRPNKRRKRKLQRQLDPNEDLEQEEEEEGFEIEEERQSRRFRLKRSVTLSSQVQN